MFASTLNAFLGIALLLATCTVIGGVVLVRRVCAGATNLVRRIFN